MEDDARSPKYNDPELANASTSSSSTAKFTLSLGGASRKHATVLQQQRSAKRARPSLLGVAVGDDADVVQHKTISTFGSTFGVDEAEAKRQEQTERVIKSIPNKNWREESRRKRREQVITGSDFPLGDSTEARVTGFAKQNEDVKTVNGSVPKFGLNVVDRNKAEGNGDEVNTKTPDGPPITISPRPTLHENSSQPPSSQTADEEALSALLGHHRSFRNAIIAPAPPTEDEVFRDSYASAARNCTLEEYEATPVEGYGAAILRGYLKEGQTLEDQYQSGTGNSGKAAVAPERRPGLLGLGAKESGLGVELGAWGKGARRGMANGITPVETTYNPLARRNRKTGELITEDDLNKRLESQRETRLGRKPYDGKEDIGRDQRYSNVKEIRSEQGSKGDLTAQSQSNSKEQDNSERDTDYSEHRERHHRREKNKDLEYDSTRLHRRREMDNYESDQTRRRDKARDYDDHELDRRRRRRDERKSYVDAEQRRLMGSRDRAINDRHPSRR